MAGKGSRPRPYSVPLKQFDSNWDSIFKKKSEEKQNGIAETSENKKESNKDSSAS